MNNRQFELKGGVYSAVREGIKENVIYFIKNLSSSVDGYNAYNVEKEKGSASIRHLPVNLGSIHRLLAFCQFFKYFYSYERNDFV